jgi:hypothetical protein
MQGVDSWMWVFFILLNTDYFISMNTQKVQASQYDKIGRENMRAALPGIIEKVLEIDIVKSADLPEKLLITKQREVDVLQQVEDSAGYNFILHIEIQTIDSIA